ncbi:uncharacterized protein BT62DRAFT_618647 [Guyanagaster necrorhizus]|uniref:DUF6535 domain-containing protein n=1 Tax=Guyanagaster necrorhizus TaxID=856835 RepID=A0A9P7VZT2_9AGAR|nr:uncharacterized protein BT62DRAFT_618647 [Guyanagaster necrorhizus MCA 3950]KAG7449987.1 hypothetical protein BT62DRAFT_618647 [Guyanagaster necrorhizus MCA 3950]
MVEETRDSVDVLLCFRWSFSAAVSTFVSQISKSLRASYTQVSATLLFEIVLIQRIIANGSSLDNVPVSSLNPYAKFTPATTDIWVNGLWSTSLSLSLVTVLIAVLVKQWLHHYLVFHQGLPKSGVVFDNIDTGGIPEVACDGHHWTSPRHNAPRARDLFRWIGRILRTAPAWPFLVYWWTPVAYTTYSITIFLPILPPQCPYRIPLSDLVYTPYRYITHDLFPKHVRRLFVKVNAVPSTELLETFMRNGKQGRAPTSLRIVHSASVS